MRKSLGKMASWENYIVQTTDQKEHECSSHIKANLEDLWDFRDNILWTDEPNVKRFGRHLSGYVWCKTKRAFHNKSIKPTVKHGGPSIHL